MPLKLFLVSHIPSGNIRLDFSRGDLRIWQKKASKWSSDMSKSTQCNVILVLGVPTYAVCNLTDLMMIILPARFLASFCVSSRISHIALDLLASTFGAILRLKSLLHYFSANAYQFPGLDV